MFTQPNAEYKVTTFDEQGNSVDTWIPVPQNLWDFFATEEQAQKLLTEKVQPVVANAQLFDGLNMDLFIPVRYLDKVTKIWVVKGTVVIKMTANSETTWAVDEYVGSLCDRQVKPNPFVDGGSAGVLGGPNLIPVPITVDGESTGIAQLKWGA